MMSSVKIMKIRQMPRILLPIIVLIALLELIKAHGYMKSPRSRNYVASEDSSWSQVSNSSTQPEPESCPHCLNLGGTLARCGSHMERNYDTPKSVSGERLPFVSQMTFNEGDEIDIEVVLTTYHHGHFEFKVCPLNSPYEVASQQCFDEYPLIFVKDLLYGAEKDKSYPFRAYLSKHYRFVYRMKLPKGLTGNNVLLQWHWLTANSCIHPGYIDYYGRNPALRDDASLVHLLDECPEYPQDGSGVPEQFWNCAEISIVPKNSDKKENPHEDKQESIAITHHDASHLTRADIFSANIKQRRHKPTLSNDSKTKFNKIRLSASHDVTIKKETKKRNYKSNLFLETSGMPPVRSLIRFDLSESIKDTKMMLSSATLKLFTVAEVYDLLTVRALATSFNEKRVTWSNTPRGTGPLVTVKKKTSKYPRWLEIDVTDAAKWSINELEQSFITLRLSTTKSGNWTFASSNYKNGRYSPQIVLTLSLSHPTTRPTNKRIHSSNDPQHKQKPKMNAEFEGMRFNRPSKSPKSPSKNVETPNPIPTSTAQLILSDNPTPSPRYQSSLSVTSKVFEIMESKKDKIDNELFLYENPLMGQFIPSSVYKFDGLLQGLKMMNSEGIAGNKFFLGDNSLNGHSYGLVNVAAFLAQSMKETIKYNACDENNWDLFNGVYPLSNACGQLGQEYEKYHCAEHERHMECSVDINMEITAVTHAMWYGAPGPFYCKPKRDTQDFSGLWDHTYECNKPWADPPTTCDTYEGQKAGQYDNSTPVKNRAGREDVQGCCWWGRGVIQTTGVCNFGKLNYFLGARAAQEGRDSPYPNIDFCKDPEIICSSQENKELKWIAGMFYWMESVQKYNEGGWNYMDELHAFVDGGLTDAGFINAVSGIVNRGCHNPPCGTGNVDGGLERAGNFDSVLKVFGLR